MKSGQALVMMLLILGIALTVGLSVVSRSVTEISVTTTAEESSRALEAAEQGVQKALAGIIAAPGGPDQPQTVTNASAQVSNVSVAGTVNTRYKVPYRLSAGEVASVDLATYSAGNIGLCWGDGAVEVMLYYQSSGGIQVGRTGFDGSNRGGLSGPNNGINCGAGYQESHNLALGGLMTGSGSPLLLRIRTLFNSDPQEVAILPQPGSALPIQGKDIVSTGQSGSATQKLHVIQVNSDLPLMFDSALFSGSQLVQ